MSGEIENEVPTLEEFDPRKVPYQGKVIKDVRLKFDYSKGVQQILLSGSVGSAKTILLAHLVITHCMLFPRARVGIGRRVMKDLKETLYDYIIQHLGDMKGVKVNKTSGIIRFKNGSKITPFSWHDGKYKKFRSIPFSMFVIEELTENEDKKFFTEILMRVGRLKKIPEKLIVCATNPDDPSHWAHEHFIEGAEKNSNIHVYYSKTRDNKFLDPSYIEFLEKNLDPKMALRMLEGLWIEISGDMIYYSYQKSKHFKPLKKYKINMNHPVQISFDFNIGHGKPMSCILSQYIDEHFHFFDEFVVEGARTEDIMEDIAAEGYLDLPVEFQIRGDATGKARHTASKRSNYDVITEFLDNYVVKTEDQDQRPRVRYELQITKQNPPVRHRHVTVNAHLLNSLGEVRVTLYEKCVTADKGLRLTKLKKGGKYIEDDSKPYQHITTAIGYCICWQTDVGEEKKQGTVFL